MSNPMTEIQSILEQVLPGQDVQLVPLGTLREGRGLDSDLQVRMDSVPITTLILCQW
jgi:hypothetical protein